MDSGADAGMRMRKRMDGAFVHTQKDDLGIGTDLLSCTRFHRGFEGVLSSRRLAQLGKWNAPGELGSRALPTAMALTYRAPTGTRLPGPLCRPSQLAACKRGDAGSTCSP